MHEHINDIIKKKDSGGDVLGGIDYLPRSMFDPQHHIKLDMVTHPYNHRRHEVDVGRSEV